MIILSEVIIVSYSTASKHQGENFNTATLSLGHISVTTHLLLIIRYMKRVTMGNLLLNLWPLGFYEEIL